MTPVLLNNRYQVLDVLATGGFGETFLAQDTHLPSNRRCVVKQLKPITNNPEIYHLVQERFHREAAILEALGETHSQIPRLYAYFAEANRFYLIQEWIEGKTLGSKIQDEGVLNERQVQQILVQTLPVLDAVHQQGIIHRDIKPSNIILRQQDGKPVLIDFGAAKETMVMSWDDDGNIAHSIAIGTPGFMAPEQAGGKPVFASDLYGLALTAIFLLTGKSPYQLGRDLQTGEMSWNHTLGISSNFAAVLNQAIQPYWGDRYPTAKAMLAALQSDALTVRQFPDTVPMPAASPSFSTPSAKPPSVTPLDAAKSVPLDSAQPETASLSSLGVPPTIAYSGSPGQSDRTVGSDNSAPDLTQTFHPVSPIALSREEYRNRQILLNKVKNYWITGVLETSLHGRALIELGLEDCHDSLSRPWGMVWEAPDQHPQSLPLGTKVIDKLDQLGAGRSLLILGDPGSGKTTTLLELTRDLISRAEQNIDHPIPVVFNLSSWSGTRNRSPRPQSIANWLVQELKTKYQVSPEIGRAWVKSQTLLLLLDGLDEVNADCRDACVEALNQFSQSYGQTEIVVCSRLKDYRSLDRRLQLQSAICLQALTLDQVHQYLSNAGSGLTAVSTALQSDTVLQELAKSPLTLNIMMLAYQGISLEALPSMDLEQQRHHLFNAYIQRMFNRRGGGQSPTQSPYSQAQAQRWLVWLAQRLSQRSETVFLIEHLQPTWLQTQTQRWMYALGLGLFAGLSSGLGGGIIGALISQQVRDGLFYGLVLGLSGGLLAMVVFGMVSPQIKPMETLKWSLLKAQENLVPGMIVGLVSGLFFGGAFTVIYNLSLSINWTLIYGLTYGVLSGLGVGLIFVLLHGLRGPGIAMKTLPNQGIWQSVGNAAFFASVGVVGLSLVSGMVGVPLIVGAIAGLLFGVFGAGEACIQHLILRTVLYFNGYTPWNYARFLNYCTNLIFLQKVGGGYIFIHRLLLEHFAAK